MSSARIQIPTLSRIAVATTVLFAALALLCASYAGDAVAAKARTSESATKKLPVVTRVTPMDVKIGQKLTITGKYIVKGSKTMRVLFQRVGSTRRFSATGSGVSSKTMSVTIPNVSGDLPGGTPSIFKLRLISRYGASKSWTKALISPTIALSDSGDGSSGATDTGPNGNCDKDLLLNGVDPDDDNDLLDDATEKTIGTDPCLPDTDGDETSDYYENRVALEWNNGLADRLKVLPYPKLVSYPNPTLPDASLDLDGDGLTELEEYSAWQLTGRMDRFYSDADQDSDNNGIFDEWEDEDHDLLPNTVEISIFVTKFPLDWLTTDTDGDGLCDGLDDQDQDGPPTPVSSADCTTAVPNNGGGDPNPLLIDGDDNVYSNWYEWAFGGGDDWINPCVPSLYPTSPSCPHP